MIRPPRPINSLRPKDLGAGFWVIKRSPKALIDGAQRLSRKIPFSGFQKNIFWPEKVIEENK
jgi:hypothetical protein